MRRSSSILMVAFLLTGCTIKIIDDTADYDIQGSMKADGCEVEINRVEAKSTGRREASAKQ